ncbi:MAG: shikimate kinase [Nitriliruptorales bacterium]|nr:shikimate kinase [Nitriliruptorales bacterium]
MSLLTPGRNIVLAGLMATGKSTVGRLIAERLGRPFADTDELIEKRTGSSVADYFDQHGERAFREAEAEQIRRVAALRGQVVAVGGGAVLAPTNVTQLRATGDIVLLDADPAALAERVGDARSRPLLAGDAPPAQRLAELRDARTSEYSRAAAFTIDTTDRTPDEIADAVLEWARTQSGLLARDELGP